MQITPEALLRSPQSSPAQGAGQSVFRKVLSSDDRINGSIPVWGPPETPAEEVLQTLGSAGSSKLSPGTNLALSLSADTATDKPAQDESFGFLDVIDMINPLQHIPLIGTAYRALTGDTIKPISQIIGGAAFGGFIGAAGGLANAIVQEETGKDIGDNLLGFVTGARGPKSSVPDTTLAVAHLGYRQPHYND